MNTLTSQQEEYNKLVASKDFKNKNHIYSTYNDSIKNYKRYRVALDSGRYNDACDELTNAAHKLAATVEWSAKYLIWVYYNKQIALYDGDSRVPSWKQYIQFKKTKDGRIADMTTHDLLEKVREAYPNQISKSQINVMDNAKIRSSLINGYKHSGKIPDASAFLETNQELYYFLKKLLIKDEEAALLSITDDYPNSWEELLVSCSYFKPGKSKHYVLLTDSIDDIGIVKNLFKIDWDMVLDLSWDDTDNQKQNLSDQYLELENRKNVILKYLCDFKRGEILPATSQTYWIKLHDRQGLVSKKEMPSNDTSVSKRIYAKLPELLKSFSSEYTMPVELIVLKCSDYVSATERLVMGWNDHYENQEELTVHVMDCDNNFLSNFIKAGHLFTHSERIKFYDLNLQQLALAIENNIGEYNEITSDVVMIPHNDMGKGTIDYNEYLAMKSVFNLVYLGIEKENEANSMEHRGGEFLRGAIQADWDFVGNDRYCIPQDSEQSIREEIIKRLKNKEKSIFSIDYEAGLGGTTFMRKMAYLLHDAYPTIIITRYIETTLVSFLLELYKNSYKEIVLFVDSNDLSFNEVSKLQGELVQNVDFSFEIVYIVRRQSGMNARRHLSRLNYNQCWNMQQNLNRYIEKNSCERHLAACVEKAKTSPMEEEHVPFMLSMYAFDENFNGIEDFVHHSLNSLSEEQYAIIFVLALADYANYKVDIQYFNSRYGTMSTLYMKRDDFVLAPLIKCVRDNTQKKERFQIRYSLFTSYILKYLSPNDTINFTALLDRIIDLVENSRRDEYGEDNDEIVKLFNKLFVEREDKQDEDIDAKGIYSPLISKLISENQHSNTNAYDGSKEAVVKIFKSLVNTYPNQPHFAGHLARYYFYNTKNYQMGFSTIKEAIDVATGIDGYAMGSLYHIEAMGYASRIKNEYLLKIREAINHYNRGGRDSADIRTIEEYLELARVDIPMAVQYFDKARREENSRFISNIAESKLYLSVQSVFNQLKEFCTDYSLDELISDMDQIDLYDRIDNLIEDCRSLLVGGKGTINNYNSTLLKQIQESKILTKANGDEMRAACRQLIAEGSPKMVRIARRKLARIGFHDVDEHPEETGNQEILKEIVTMMENNFEDDSSTNANFRIWFKALRGINVDDSDIINELDDTLLKLEKWTSEPNASADAFYYKYIVKFILAFEEGTLEGNAEVREELSQMLQDLIRASEKMPKRTIPFEWFSSYHKGLRRLITSADINDMGKNDAIQTLYTFRGELPGKDSFQARQAYISFKQIPVYFNPQSISDRITATSENQYVDFGLGFSYSGLRSYHDSIRIHKGKSGEKDIQILAPGMEVTAEVTGFKDYYVVTSIRESGGKHCHLKYDQFEPFGFDKENKPPKRKMFKIVLIKTTTLNSGEEVWHADLIVPTSTYNKKQDGGYRPFANIGDLFE